MTPGRTYAAPQPQQVRIPMLATAFALIGGPLAWFVELCVNYGLASWSCFPKDHRGITPMAGIRWSGPAILAIWSLSILIAVLALLASWRLFRQTREAREKDYRRTIEDGDGRLAFLAFWGMFLSGGALITILADAIAFAVLPRCGG